MTKARKPAWPKELSDPIVIRPASRATVPFGALAPGHDDFSDRLRAEMKRRVDLIANHLRIKPPKTWDPEWLMFTAAICKHWQIPGLTPPMKKASRAKWNDQKLCELFADVCAVQDRDSSYGDLRACRYIAKHHSDYGSRYLIGQKPTKDQIEAWAKTLHRQFLNFKQKAENSTFRHTHFGTSKGLGLLNQHTPEIGPDLCRIAIDRYASNSPPKVA
jgi:hypothetical protein